MTGEETVLADDDGRVIASRRVAVAALAAATLASVIVPGTPTGLGTTLVVFTMAAAVATAKPVELDARSLLLLGLALALAAMPTLRSAEWVIGMDLLAAAGLGALAVTNAETWRAVLWAPASVIARVGRAARFLVEPLLPRPGVRRRLGPALRGAGLAALLLLVFGTLFATADTAFAEIVGDLLVPDIDLSLLPARIMVFGLVLLGSGALILAGRRYAGTPHEVAVEPTRGLGRVEWLTALTLLDLLFAGFVAVQIAVFFGGREHVLETTGLTFAEYARQGFFQLVAVGALTFAVIAGSLRWARRESSRDRRALQLLLGVLSVLSLVVLASAFRRLTLYESVFGYTRLRISVHAVILWMGVLFLLLLIAGVKMRAPWLPTVVVAVTACSLLAFNLADPDLLVARRNVERFQATGRIDLPYLAFLSPDAVPALAELPPRLRGCALWTHSDLGVRALRWGGRQGEAAEEYLSPMAWNYGRRRAAKYIPPRQPAAPAIACHAAARMGLWP